MSDTITHATVTVASAAHAAGFSLRGLRLIMGTHDVPLLGQAQRAAGCWHRFASVDVVRLAVLRRLLEHGFKVPDAVDVIGRTVDEHVFGLVRCGLDLPAHVLCDRMRGAAAHVWRHAGRVHVELTPADVAPRHAHGTWLTLALGSIASEALDRLAGCS